MLFGTLPSDTPSGVSPRSPSVRAVAASSDDDLAHRLGANLRAIRVRRGLSQLTMSLAIGMHYARYGELERGHLNPTLQSIERLAAKIGIDPLDLLK